MHGSPGQIPLYLTTASIQTMPTLTLPGRRRLPVLQEWNKGPECMIFLVNYLEAVGNGLRWQLVETGIHQGESQWAGVQPGHKSLQKFSLLFGGEGHCNVSLGCILTFFPFFCKRRTLNN